MPNLRLLEIIGAHDVEGDFRNLLQELRCIRWSHCPWKRLPSSFHPPKLVSLHMLCSDLKTLWNDVEPLGKLKTINLSYSRNLKIMPDFTNVKLVDKLIFRGCKSLLQVHPSIGRLTNLSHLDLGECNHLKRLTEQIGQLNNLGHLDLGQCVNLKRLPEAIIQLNTLSSLNLGHCHNLTRLPEQLGDMKCLKMLDASYTSIEQLPDSIGHLKELVDLKLYQCTKLRKLPAQIGNMESLKLFDASYSAIEYLPDTFTGLVNLDKLHLSFCKNLTSLPSSFWKLKVLEKLDLYGSSKLEQLPEQLGKLQCLKYLHLTGTAIEELPESIRLMSMLKVLDFENCEKFRNLPSSIWNLTSPEGLRLDLQNLDTIILPDMVKDMKLKSLQLTCDVNLWLPVILSLSSLEKLELHCESQSFFQNEPYSLSKLSNLQHLRLYNKNSHECSFPELPLNLKELGIFGYKTLEMLPDLSSLKQLKILSLRGCISLQSIPPLPPHLEEFYLVQCTSLQDLPDLSILKELRKLKMINCIYLKSNSLKQSFLQVEQHKLNSFRADIPNKEVAEWFSYKSSGNTLSFTIPPNSGDKLLGVVLWIVYKFKFINGRFTHLIADITNITKDIKTDYHIYPERVGEVQSRLKYITPNYFPMESGDRIKVFISSGEVKVKSCGAHVISRKHC